MLWSLATEFPLSGDINNNTVLYHGIRIIYYKNQETIVFFMCLGYYLLFHDNAHPHSAHSQTGQPFRHLALFYFYLNFKNGEYVVRNE